MAIDYQLKLKEAADRFCDENPEMVYSKTENRWFSFNGKVLVDATDDFEEKTISIWEDNGLRFDVHLKNLRKLCAVKKAVPNPLNENSEMLLNTPDGVIVLDKYLEIRQSGQNPKDHTDEWIRPHDEFKANRLTNITGASYKANSLLPEKFLKFTTDLFQKDLGLLSYFLKFLAYYLTGLISQQFFHVLFGIGRNGKSTLLEIFKELFGTYFCNLGNDILVLQKDEDKARRILYQARHKRLILFNEQNEKFKLNTSLVKLLTGDDIVSAKINQRNVDFKGQFKILLNTNHIPEIGSIENKGMWERLRVLITQPPIPEDQREDEFYKKIVGEKDQILTYIIENYLVDVINSGLKEMPQIMKLTKMFKEFSENPVEYFFDQTTKLAIHPVNKKQWVQARYYFGQYCQFHLLTSKMFEKILKIRADNPSRKVLVPPATETAFSRKMHSFGVYEKKASEMYYTNIYFSDERVYSELGEKIESDDLESLKNKIINKFEDVLIRKQQAERMIISFCQLKAMWDMVSETEDRFEDPHPAGILDTTSAITESSKTSISGDVIIDFTGGRGP
jgi:P4 family phage/plasmid primase-like protien